MEHKAQVTTTRCPPVPKRKPPEPLPHPKTVVAHEKVPRVCRINAKVPVIAVQVTETFSFMRRARCGAATKSRPFKKRGTRRSYSASSGRVSVVHGTESARVSTTASRLEQFDAHRAENRRPKKRSVTEVFGSRRPPTTDHRKSGRPMAPVAHRRTHTHHRCRSSTHETYYFVQRVGVVCKGGRPMASVVHHGTHTLATAVTRAHMRPIILLTREREKPWASVVAIDAIGDGDGSPPHNHLATIVARAHTRPIILSNKLRSCARVADRWHRWFTAPTIGGKCRLHTESRWSYVH